MSGRELVRSIAEDFLAYGVPASVLFGRGHLAEQPIRSEVDGSFMRVVFVPGAFEYGAPLESGGSDPNESPGNPQERANRRQTFSVHVHARAPTQVDALTQHEEDTILAELLADQVAAAMVRKYEGSSINGPGSFNEDPTTVGFGATLQFAVSVDITVKDSPWVVVDDADPTIQGAIVNSVTSVETEGMGVG